MWIQKLETSDLKTLLVPGIYIELFEKETGSYFPFISSSVLLLHWANANKMSALLDSFCSLGTTQFKQRSYDNIHFYHMKKTSKSLQKYMMVEIILLKVNMLNSGGSTGEIWMHGAQHANSVNPAPKTENTHFLYFLKLGNPWALLPFKLNMPKM